MPTWGEILKEIEATRTTKPPSGDQDGIRRKYLARLNKYTGRPAIIYYTAFLESRSGIPPLDLQIHLGDVQAMMECVSGIAQERSLDLIIHSPGGSAEATESLVAYLRSRFTHIRAIIPVAAMSAATMLALSCNEIIMARHSQLGPIDPQFIIATPEGPRSAPAQAILDQFEMAKEECQDTKKLPAWMPILRTYAPGLLVQCKDQRALAERMVTQWLQDYMFAGDSEAGSLASRIAAWFADYQRFKSHGRPVRIEQLREEKLGLRVIALEDDQQLQDAVLSVHHATMHTFSRTLASKIVENNLGKAYVRMSGPSAVLRQEPTPPKPTQQPQPNRAERRRQN